MDGVEKRKKERQEQEARRKKRNAEGKQTLVEQMKRAEIKLTKK